MVASNFSKSTLSQAKEFLTRELADGDRHPVGELMKKAEALDISERTLQRASIALNLQKQATLGPGGKGVEGWTWQLPKEKARRRRQPVYQ